MANSGSGNMGPSKPEPDSAAMPPSSWAKRTGFRPKFSGETNASDSGQITSMHLPQPPAQAQKNPRDNDTYLDLESGRPTPNGEAAKDKKIEKDKEKTPPARKRRDSDGGKSSGQNGLPAVAEGSRRAVKNEECTTGNVLPLTVEDDGVFGRQSHMKYELRDTPGLVPIGFYGLQHYLSILDSLISIPLVIVPTMGGTYEDMANVVLTVLFVSGMTTPLHTSFGSRLPLIQGPSFVFLAPALAIINSPEFLRLNGNNFKHIMKELQGAIIIGSAFQAFLAYSGLMTVLIRLINPVVVCPTIAAVGLSFYSYGFPRVGTCIEIGLVQILLVIIFSLYLRKISVLGHRLFLIYAVPLSLAITWATAFLLTEAGAYNYKALLVASSPPTRGVVSRGIGLEGISSILAGLGGMGTGSTTLTENVHTIAVTKVGSRRAVELGGCVLIVLSLVGKIGGFIASIPEVMVSALLCFMWAMLTALGLSNLRYSEAGSSRNIIIVGLSLFFSLSVPAYFQQYGVAPNSNLSVPSYFQPYIVASHGPIHTKSRGLNYVLNTLLSLHMVVAFLVALVLDNTVPGSRQERGVYVWSGPEVARREPAVSKDYELPLRVGKLFRWVKWVGL